jgi:hypothetical protein
MAINDKAGVQRPTSHPFRESPGKGGLLPRKLGCAKGLAVFFGNQSLRPSPIAPLAGEFARLNFPEAAQPLVQNALPPL